MLYYALLKHSEKCIQSERLKMLENGLKCLKKLLAKIKKLLEKWYHKPCITHLGKYGTKYRSVLLRKGTQHLSFNHGKIP